MEIRDKIREFIRENILIGLHNVSFGDDDSFLDDNIIDSTGILELVAYLEDEFGVEVRDSELVPDNFNSLSQLSRYVESKIGG